MSGNLAVARALYAAFNRRDRQAIEALLGNDFFADMSQSVGPERGTYDGAKGLGQLLDAYWEALETFEIMPTELIELGDAVVVVTKGRGVGRASGAEVNARAAHVLNFKDGKLVRWTAFQSRTEAFQAAARTNTA